MISVADVGDLVLTLALLAFVLWIGALSSRKIGELEPRPRWAGLAVAGAMIAALLGGGIFLGLVVRGWPHADMEYTDD